MKNKMLQTVLPLLAVLLSAAAANATTRTGILGNYSFVDDLTVLEFNNAQVQLNNGSQLNGQVGVYVGPIYTGPGSHNDNDHAQIQLNNGSVITHLILPQPLNGSVQIQVQNGSSINSTSSSPGLQQDASAAVQASVSLANMPATGMVPGAQYNGNGQNGQLQLNNGQTVTIVAAGQDVFDLNQISLNNGSTLNLDGTSPNTRYIFNIGQLQLNGGSHIMLNGVSPADVVFNVLNGGNVQLNNGSELEGTLLAVNGQVQMNNGSNAIIGAVISSKLDLNNGSVISGEY